MNRNLRRTIDLFLILTYKEITIKYKRTYMGFLWSLMNPILSALVYLIAFKIFMRFQMKDYSLFLLSALFPWTWFSVSILMCTNVLIGNISLIKKVIFPKYLLLVSVISGQLLTLVFSLPILAALLLYYGKTPSLTWIYGVPILIIVQFFVIYGMSLSIAMLNAHFRDMEYITNVCINMLFWMTPIMYPLDMVPEKYRIILILNPMTYIIQSWRDVIMKGTMNWHHILISAISAVVLMLLGNTIFTSMDKKLDEVL